MLDALAYARRMDADVAAIVCAQTSRRTRDVEAIVALGRRVSASCRLALATAIGSPYEQPWRDLCVAIAALVECASNGASQADAEAALARLRAILAENADLLA